MILNLSVKMPSSPPGSGTKHPAVLKNTRVLLGPSCRCCALGRVPSPRRVMLVRRRRRPCCVPFVMLLLGRTRGMLNSLQV